MHLESRLSPARRCSSAQQSLVIWKQPCIYACETAWAYLLTLYILSHFVMYWMWPRGIREYLSVLTEELLVSLFKACEHEPPGIVQSCINCLGYDHKEPAGLNNRNLFVYSLRWKGGPPWFLSPGFAYGHSLIIRFTGPFLLCVCVFNSASKDILTNPFILN